jgi:hypothetical protein
MRYGQHSTANRFQVACSGAVVEWTREIAGVVGVQCPKRHLIKEAGYPAVTIAYLASTSWSMLGHVVHPHLAYPVAGLARRKAAKL